MAASSSSSDLFFEKGLPSNLEAERSILGAILLDNSVCNQAMEMMRRDDFFLDSHRRIYDKMILLSERGSSIDMVTLSEELRRASEFEQVGGATYIASLIDGVPRNDNLEPYVKIVKNKALLRQIITASEQSKSEAFNEELEPDEIYTRAQRRFDDIGEVNNSIGNGFKLLKAEDLDKLPPIEWLIENEIPRNSFTVLFGASGAGKSFVSLDYAARVGQFAPVVYVAAEGVSGYASRLRAWSQHHHKSVGQLYFFLQAIQMQDATALRGFLREVKPVGPVLIVIDTLARCLLGGDENSAKDMGLFIESCARIQRETGATVLVIHHSGKSAAGPRGSSALYGAADSIIELLNDDGLIQVRCEKLKDSSPFETRCLRLIEVAESCVAIPANKVLMDDAKLTERQKQILDSLNLAIFKETGATYKRLQEITKLPSSSLSYSLSNLKEKDLVGQASKGEPYYITEKGKLALSSNAFQDQESSRESNHFNNNGKSFQSFQLHSNGNSNGADTTSNSIPTNSNPPLGVGMVGIERSVGNSELEEGAL